MNNGRSNSNKTNEFSEAVFGLVRPQRPPLTPQQIAEYRERIKDPDWYKEPLKRWTEEFKARASGAL